MLAEDMLDREQAVVVVEPHGGDLWVESCEG
jgi:hypothetical protein